MHAERLNSLSGEILATYTEQDPVARLDQLIAAVNQRISNPSDPQFDKNMSTARVAVRSAVDALKIDEFPPISRKLMEDLGLRVLFPEEIRERIDEAFQDRFVDSEVVTALVNLRDEIRDVLTSLTALRAGFGAMKIAEDKLAADEVELNAAMPRDAIDDHLGGFSKVLALLNTELTVLASIARDDREPLKINSISTNDFTVALNINVDLGDIVQSILLALIYMRVGYRTQIDALKAPALAKMPAAIIDAAVAWARGYVDEEIKKIVDKLPELAPDSVDPVKLEAHRTSVVEAVKYLNDKQELGFNIEVRTGAPEEDITEEAEVDVAKRQAINSRRAKIREISAKAAQLKVLTAQNTPILSIGVDRDEEEPGIKPAGE